MTEIATNVQPTQDVTPPNQPKSGMSPVTGLIVILLCTVLFAGAFLGIGKLFFWNNYSKDSKLDVELKQNLEKVQNDPNNASNHINLGWSYFLKGENERAVAEYKKALALDPKNYAANYDMGQAYMSLKQYDKAITSLKEAISVVPNTFPPHLNLAISYYKTNHFDEALKELELSYKYNPGNPETFYWRGMVYEKQNRLEDAYNAYGDAISFSPKYKEAQDAYARLKQVLKK